MGTMQIYIIKIPVAKGRPKFVKRGKFVTSYTPKKTRDYEEDLKIIFKKRLNLQGGQEPLYPKEAALKVKLGFDMPIPKSKAKHIDEEKHTVRPDIDNLTKAVLDAANGTIWKDDSQIVQIEVTKNYSQIPGIYLEVEEV